MPYCFTASIRYVHHLYLTIAHRDCGWRVAREALPCLPGRFKTIDVSIETRHLNRTQIRDLPVVVVRICESSRELGNISTRCEYVDAIKHALIIPNRVTRFRFKCPRARDNVETGGLFSILAAKFAAFEVLDLLVPNITVV